jgi:hypothetical protein
MKSKQRQRGARAPSERTRQIHIRELPDDIHQAIEAEISDFASREGLVLTRTQVIERRLRQAYGLVGAA